MGPGYIPWVSVDFAPILPLALQKCEHLYFEGVNELWTIGSLHQLSHFSTVTELSLYRFATSVPELCAFISTFPNLERCIIRSFRDLGSGGVTFDDCSYLPGPRLKLLHIKSYHFPLASDDPFEQGFLEWVLGTESRYTLRDIAITAQNSNIEAVGDLLRVVGPQLEHLEIICQGLGSSRESRDDESEFFAAPQSLLVDISFGLGIHNHLDLTRLTELRSLRLQYPTYIMIHALVSTITSPFLHTLSFQIRLRSTYNIVSGKHQSIAQLFGQKKLKDRLKLVRFDYESEHDAHMVQKLFEITYDDFLGPGVLQVNQVEGDMPDI
ncbi:hypothetical protein NLI96_g4712 [Meripilus lineatus]|uniref:Uncharacterized protein n=1 Tax=Meripilus lineatus TaxID=2056292 RepID=A0AAD5V403_9APHY|nr:hypothetical protein NLI96_g4712 [Physisporinus lineatus]